MAHPTSIQKFAVYFGSFDPIHVNHLSLCRDLLNKGFQHVYLVPNPHNNLKPFMVSREHRLEMIRQALENHSHLSVYDSQVEQHTWEGRYKICDLIRNQKQSSSTDESSSSTEESSSSTEESIEVCIVIGQDSFEKALKRCRTGQGIHQIKSMKLLVYPRLGYQSNIVVPQNLKSSVIVMDDYQDPMACSSSTIRDLLMTERLNSPSLPIYLPAKTFKYINTHQLYSPRYNNRRIIAILGSPGSGKGTICDELVKCYPHYIHISTGDLYREAESQKTAAYFRVQEAKVKGPTQYMDALNLFIIERLKDLIQPNQYYLIDGFKPTDLAVFESQIALIDSIVYLKCTSSCAEARLKKRQGERQQGRKDDTDQSILKRLGNYYKFLWIQTEILNNYQTTGRCVLTLNAEKPINFLMAHPLWKTILQRKPQS